MAATNAIETLKPWLAAINAHDVNALATLMAPEHTFVDSRGNRVTGASAMEAGWRGYFALCPDFWVRADLVTADGDTLLAAGEAGGTMYGESWRTPTAWQAVIREGKVSEWRVFADNKPAYDIVARHRP